MNNENVLLKSKDLTICVNNIQLSNAIAERNYIQQLYEEQRSINEQQTSEITELLNQLAQSTAIHTENECIRQKNQSDQKQAYDKLKHHDELELRSSLRKSHKQNSYLKTQIYTLQQTIYALKEQIQLKINECGINENQSREQINILQNKIESMMQYQNQLVQRNLQYENENQNPKEKLQQFQQDNSCQKPLFNNVLNQQLDENQLNIMNNIQLLDEYSIISQQFSEQDIYEPLNKAYNSQSNICKKVCGNIISNSKTIMNTNIFKPLNELKINQRNSNKHQQVSKDNAENSISIDIVALKSSKPQKSQSIYKFSKIQSDLSIISINSDSETEIVNINNIQPKKTFVPRYLVTDHCLEEALRSTLKQWFKVEKQEIFNQFNKQQLVEFVNKQQLNDNFWFETLNRCSPHFSEKRNSQSPLKQIKQYCQKEMKLNSQISK
ncbi:Hypothetical_protein [Hexamita inflata]|uniref:Hypothetical_protein n=1 Tax=Hexamita inflata TaxID=28002 RepID=A0AA86UWI1_9EUKA|nr:Hypothetical protein HINF_LOCUS62340 [Hexamita inflata]